MPTTENSSILNLTIPSSANDRKHWCNLKGSASALAICQAANAHDGLTLVIAANTSEAYRLEEEIAFFTGGHVIHDLTTDKIGSIPLLSLPDWETLPYDSFSPHQDIVSQRLATLYKLPQIRQGIMVLSLTTLMHRVSPSEFIQGRSLVMNVGELLDIDTTRLQLEASGYHHVDTVFEHGEYTVRGSILDIFPMGSAVPYRIELFDDEIETLRTFDPESQRSVDKVEEINLLPAKEFPLDKSAIRSFKDAFRDQFDVDHRDCMVYQDVSEGLAAAGVEYYLPLFFEQMESLFNYFPSNTLIMHGDSLQEGISHFWQDIEGRYEQLKHDIQRPILPPNQLFLSEEELFTGFKQHARVILHDQPSEDGGAGWFNIDLQPFPDIGINAKAEQPLARLRQFLDDTVFQNTRVLFCAESAGRRETLLELLKRIQVKPVVIDSWHEFYQQSDLELAITVGPLQSGIYLQDSQANIALISEPQLFGNRVSQQRRRKKSGDDNGDFVIKNLTELTPGTAVVHLDHGVGRYLGLQSLQVDGQDMEFLTLEYANGAKLYVPVSSLHLISRFSGANDKLAPLHKLGTDTWSKEKRKAAEQVHDTAAELLNIYARRAAQKGYQYKVTLDDYELFAEAFPFEETPDQQSAIEAVVNDLRSENPTDRLVCGDVGFGKTEVAMRAAFVAVQNSKQVAILVPTTLLAQQHYESFKDRFADWPVNIEVLSRFKTTKEQTQAIKDLNSGKIDIIVGTHKLIQESIKFKQLGLIIIDEEHRFGVRHKEKLKSLRTSVDILTLTATPIPRTLNMAMSGVRDLSIIATPPAKRLSIKTFVRLRDSNVIKEAILRELLRGGQVYYLHNEVKTIEKVAKEIEELVPEARIAVAHGQMRERQLEQVMSDFYHKRFNVLICTTIIETGIDVPTANTIIMDRADKLGLAQLHQLRGRVGRSHHQAYAFLLTPHKKAMTADAIKRLDAISNANDLGAGFTLASHDLEIRGAGELLGDEQSGHINRIGFSLYMEMLESAVEAIKKGETPNLDKPLEHGTEVNLRLPALITEDYLPDVHNRLIMYKRISNAKNDQELEELKVEMIDRFGLLPEPTKNLFKVTQMKLHAQTLGINKIEAGPSGGRFEFSTNAKVDPLTIVKMVQSQPQIYKLEGADRLKFSIDMEESSVRFEQVEALIDRLTKAVA